MTGACQQTGCHGASRGTILSHVQGWNTSHSILRFKPDTFWSLIPCRNQPDLTGSLSWIKTSTSLKEKPEQHHTIPAGGCALHRHNPNMALGQGQGHKGPGWARAGGAHQAADSSHLLLLPAHVGEQIELRWSQAAGITPSPRCLQHIITHLGRHKCLCPVMHRAVALHTDHTASHGGY